MLYPETEHLLNPTCLPSGRNKVNAEPQVARHRKRPVRGVVAWKSRSRGFRLWAEGIDGGANQQLDACLALRIRNGNSSGGAITLQSLIFPAELGVKVSARQLKKRVGRIFLRQRSNNVERTRILLVVAMQIHGEVKAGHVGSESAVGNRVLEQANAFLFRTTGNAHEESKNPGHGAEGVHV